MRNYLLKYTGLVCLALLTFYCTACNKKELKKRPNVLFLFADDQRADALGCSGNTYIKTPNIDKLSETGIRFTNNYVMGGHQAAVCAPSRAMLMSGKSLFHVFDVLDGVKTMPMHFAEKGYETFGTGKWHNGQKSFEASFEQGENVFLGGMCDHYQVPCQKLTNGKLGEIEIKGYSTDIFAEAAINYLAEYAKGSREKPFFCYVAFTAPHDPRSPRKDYIGMYPDETVPLPGNFKKYHPFQFDDMKIRDENLAAWPRNPETIQASLADYYALISHLDNWIGDIIEELKKQNLFDNTIIVYTADNGLAIGSHGLLGKQNLYEHSTKVPLIISGPGIPHGKISEALVYLFDLFPTLSELCHLTAPAKIDGKNLVPVIKGKEQEVRNSLFTTYKNTIRAVRTNEWKLIRYPQRDYNQLFNLTNDPLEINNLAYFPNYESKIEEMFNLLSQWQNEVDDTLSLTSKVVLPLDYKPEDFIQVPDVFQPEYILKKYYKGVSYLRKSIH